MNPMVRINPTPARRSLAPETRAARARPVRRVTLVKVMVWLSFAFGALTALSGLLTAALLAFVSGATLLIVDGIAAREAASQERLEAISKELFGLRQHLAQLANSGLAANARPVGAAREEGGTDAATSLLGAEVSGHAQPQPAGD